MTSLAGSIQRLGRALVEINELTAELEAAVAASQRELGREVTVVHLPCRLDTLQRAAIEAALKETNGNRLRAARLLGMSRSTLYDRVEQFAAADARRSLQPANPPAKKRAKRR